MTAPLHPRTFAIKPRGFGRRAVTITELRARANRRADLIQTARDLALLIFLPLAVGVGIITLGGF